jgi:hypothetical protein
MSTFYVPEKYHIFYWYFSMISCVFILPLPPNFPLFLISRYVSFWRWFRWFQRIRIRNCFRILWGIVSELFLRLNRNCFRNCFYLIFTSKNRHIFCADHWLHRAHNLNNWRESRWFLYNNWNIWFSVRLFFSMRYRRWGRYLTRWN